MKCALTLTKRDGRGKGASRKLRRGGGLPGVLYGKGNTMSITLNPLEFNKVLREKQHGHVLITLTEEHKKGGSQHNAILKDVQFDPVSGHVLHADLLEVAMDQPIQVTIPIAITGSTPIGVTLGGILRQRQRYLPVEGLPAAIPDRVEIDASPLDIGQVVRLKDIFLEPGIKVCDDLEKIVVNIAAKKFVETEEREPTEVAVDTPASAAQTS